MGAVTMRKLYIGRTWIAGSHFLALRVTSRIADDRDITRCDRSVCRDMLGEIEKLQTALNTSKIPDRKAGAPPHDGAPWRRAVY